MDELLLQPDAIQTEPMAHSFGERPGSGHRPYFLVPYANRTEAVAVPMNRAEYDQLTPHELYHYILHYHNPPR